jgi:hypothetical protein
MRSVQVWMIAAVVVLVAGSTSAAAQDTQPETRRAAIEQTQADKAQVLHPYVVGKGERILDKAQDILIDGLRWYPFFESAYAGGGFPFGLGYKQHVSPYNLIDVRGSYTLSGYKRAEAEFIAPHLFRRRGQLSVLGGWREATEVGFFGIGPDSSKAQRTSYEFEQPYAAATLSFMPTRQYWSFGGGLELTRWSQRPGRGPFPSVETAFTPETLPGLGGEATYVHTQGSVSFDWRPSPGYVRRGGYYGVTVHDYADTNSAFGFTQVDYEAVQHFPILREAWVVSLRAQAQTAFDKDGQQVPFFMLPSLGGTSSLRGYAPWRFRDRNSLLLQGEWRIMANRYLDTAVFYDAGKVGAHTSDLDLQGLQHDYGFGVRFHSVDATVLRVDVARSHEGTRLVVAAYRVF